MQAVLTLSLLSPGLLHHRHSVRGACYCLVIKLCLTLLWAPWTPPSWDFVGKNTGVGCHFLLSGSLLPRDRTSISCIGWQILFHLAIGKPKGTCVVVQLLSLTKVSDFLTPMDYIIPGSPVLHCPPALFKFMFIESVMLFNHLMLCCPFFILPRYLYP